MTKGLSKKGDEGMHKKGDEGMSKGDEKGDEGMKEEFVHILSQEDQPYGSERRCCNYCGIMLWGSAVPSYVADWAAWRALPNNCRAALEIDVVQKGDDA